MINSQSYFRQQKNVQNKIEIKFSAEEGDVERIVEVVKRGVEEMVEESKLKFNSSIEEMVKRS